jgi:alanine dehydrogenase
VIVGVPKEIKPGEQRVALTPAGARTLSEHGHKVVVEREAGLGSGIRDDDFANNGARLVTADDVWRTADLVLKVKEPLPSEWPKLRAGQILFTYLHHPITSSPRPCARAMPSPSPTRQFSALMAACPC